MCIRDSFKTGRPLTSWEAINKFHCTRLAAVVSQLKKEGMNIETTMKTNKETRTNYAEYTCTDVYVNKEQTSLFNE